MKKSCKDFTIAKYPEYRSFLLILKCLKHLGISYPRTSVPLKIIPKNSVLCTNHFNSTHIQ